MYTHVSNGHRGPDSPFTALPTLSPPGILVERH